MCTPRARLHPVPLGSASSAAQPGDICEDPPSGRQCNARLLSSDAFPSRPAATRSQWQQFHQTDPAIPTAQCDCVLPPFASPSSCQVRACPSAEGLKTFGDMPEASPGGESRPRLCEKGRRSRQRKTKQEKSPPLRRFAKGHAGPGLQLQLAPRHLGGEAQHVLPPARAGRRQRSRHCR